MSRRVVRVRCTTHCSKCGSHFTSVAAFDAHRRGKFRPKPGERGRYCVSPEDAAAPDGGDLFVVAAERGICDIFGSVRKNVVIWGLAPRYERRLGSWILNGDSKPTREELQRMIPAAQPPQPPQPVSRRRRRRGGRSLPVAPAPPPVQYGEITIRQRPRRKK